MKRHLQFWLRMLLRGSRPSVRGFTLTELLVVAIVGSMIITGLLTLVVQLMTTDRHENVRLETNREMQMALDYMSNELKEAIYVYTGHCLMAQTDPNTNLACVDSPAIGNPDAAFFPNTGANAIASENEVPVLVFWKQQPIPAAVRETCDDGANPPVIGTDPVPCSTASSYALVMYSLSTSNPNNTWRGGARIKRYILQEFASTTSRTQGYTPPQGSNDTINFIEWVPSGRAGGGAAVLVDFVNGTPGTGVSCPLGYSISPHPQALANASGVDNALRSFYACVSPPPNQERPNQDVQLFLQGSIVGRIRGVQPEAGQLTTLQTRVMARSILNAR